MRKSAQTCDATVDVEALSSEVWVSFGVGSSAGF